MPKEASAMALIEAIPSDGSSLCASCPTLFDAAGLKEFQFEAMATSPVVQQAYEDGRRAISIQEAKSLTTEARASHERVGELARCLIRRANGGCVND